MTRVSSNPAKKAYDAGRYADVRGSKITSAQKWYAENTAGKREYDSARRPVKNARRRADYARSPQKYKEAPGVSHYHKLKRYGLSIVGFLAMFHFQGGRCGCCGATENKGRHRWAVDHDHTSLEVRGVLCGLCNTGIGALGDNLAGVLRAVAYLANKR